MMQDIWLFGCGRMGSALLAGWLNAPWVGRVLVIDPQPLSPRLAADGRVLHQRSLPDVPAFPPDVVVIAVKPQQFDSLVTDIRAHLPPSCLLISIAAGKSLSEMENLLPSQPVVQAMPNLPAEIGQGMSAAIANSRLSAAQREVTAQIFQSVGDFVWVDDAALMPLVTAISGSGPAYLFALVEALAAAAIAEGMELELAQRLARQTIIGASAQLSHSPLQPAQLRDQVTSPGGTTAAGLAVLLAENGLYPLLQETVRAARQRAEELARA